jgi:hypothetical protein
MTTVDIILPTSTFIFQSIEERPIAHPELWTDAVLHKEPLGIKTRSGDVVVWNLDGTTDVITENGTYKKWWPKMTIADAIASTKWTNSSCFQFNKDGSVMVRCYGRTYYWPATELSEPISGDMIYPVIYNGKWSFDPDIIKLVHDTEDDEEERCVSYHEYY